MGFVFCLATLGVWLGRRPASVPVRAAQHELPDTQIESPVSTQRPDRDTDRKHSRSRASSQPDPHTPTIKLAKVEKTEVCRGEDNFLNVEAHTAKGTDAFLTVRFDHPVTGQTVRGGSRIPFRLDAPSERGLDIVVEGGHATVARLTLPPVKVKDCDAPLQVEVKQSRTMEAPDRVTFSAQIKEPADLPHARRQPFVATDFEWDFGDGQRQRTKETSIEHSYEARDQGVTQSSFVVTVKASDARGLQASGTHGVVLVNLGFPQLVYKNRVTLTMGMALPDAESGKPARRWMYHGYSRPVRLTQVKLREIMFDKDHHEVELSRQDYSPDHVFGFYRLDPKTSQPVRDWTEFVPTEPGHIRLIEVSGSTDDGKEALGAFSLLPRNRPQPLEKPTDAIAKTSQIRSGSVGVSAHRRCASSGERRGDRRRWYRLRSRGRGLRAYQHLTDLLGLGETDSSLAQSIAAARDAIFYEQQQQQQYVEWRTGALNAMQGFENLQYQPLNDLGNDDTWESAELAARR
ncbi:MAG TPA: PKD domain-containing protein [Polyangiaceae bacterium]|nr:PKD domain-containing protein [Polyangiaceae bacterium]